MHTSPLPLFLALALLATCAVMLLWDTIYRWWDCRGRVPQEMEAIATPSQSHASRSHVQVTLATSRIQDAPLFAPLGRGQRMPEFAERVLVDVVYGRSGRPHVLSLRQLEPQPA